MKTRHLILTLFVIYVFPVISVTFAEEIESDSIDESTLCGENAVTLSGSLVIMWFLIMMFIGIWPQMGA